jgi:hypothetical protein
MIVLFISVISSGHAPVPDGWAIATAIGTVGATMVALGLGFYQWFKDRKRQGDVRRALATALYTDLRTWHEVIDAQRRSFDAKELKSERAYMTWVHTLRSPVLPTFERFYLILPDLGQSISTKVVRAYTEAMRVGELISWEIGKPGVVERDYVNIAIEIRKHLAPVSDRLATAMSVLKPFAED